MLKLEQRSAMIGNVVTGKTEFHGDQAKSAIYIPISDVALTPEELGDVLLVPKAHKLLYKSVRNRPAEPVFGSLLQPLQFAKKISGVTVSILLARKIVRITDCTLSGAAIKLDAGGTAKWSFKIHCVPDLVDDLIDKLIGKLSSEVLISIQCEGYGAQPELPLEETGEGYDEE